MHKKGFTLIEIVIGMVLIGIGLTAIMGVLQYATKLNNTTKAQIVATNLAREGVESIFAIRDTNRKIFSSKKDACWLAVFPIGNVTQCELLPWISDNPGKDLQLGENYVGNTYYGIVYTGDRILKPTATTLDVKENNGETAGSQPYRMCFKDNTRKMCNDMQDQRGTRDASRQQTKYGKFRRAIIVKGLYLKDNNPGGTHLNCPTGNDVDSVPCSGPEPKELRFCSRVDYQFDAIRRIELCSAMTNFLE